MRRLVAYGLAATLAVGAATPAAAINWTGCSNPLNVCMDFVLTEPTAGNFVLRVGFEAPDYPLGTLNAFGLLDDDPAVGPTVTPGTAAILNYTGYVAGDPMVWAIGSQGLGGGVWVTAGANPGDGLPSPGFVEIGFESTDGLSEFEVLTARAHVQRLTSASCSMQWSSASQGYVQSTGCLTTDQTTPEPVSLILLGTGLLGLGGVRMRRRNKK